MLNSTVTEENSMLKKELDWFFIVFGEKFRTTSVEAFQVFIFFGTCAFFRFLQSERTCRFYGDQQTKNIQRPEIIQPFFA